MRRWLASLLISSFYYPLVVASVMASPVPVNDITLTFSSTSRQIVIKYTAPDTTPCTVEGSESPTYAPLVPDVDPTLFPGSDSDSRIGALGAGTTARTFVLGTVEARPNTVIPVMASDGKIYSRAQRLNTTHYIRVNCSGGHTGTGSFATKNIQLGLTRARTEPIAAAGLLGWPTQNYDANSTQTYVDPTSGLKMFRFLPARATISEPLTSKSVFGATALGTNWTNPDNALADDSSSAVYSGTTQDWLGLKLPNFGIAAQYFLYSVKLWVKGNATGAGDNAVLQACISKDGTTCFSDLQEIALVSTANTEHCYPNNGTSTTCTNEPATYNTWKSRAGGRPLVAADVSSCATCYIMVRKKGTGAGTINVQYASWDFLVDYLPALYDNGAQQAWSRGTVNDAARTVTDVVTNGTTSITSSTAAFSTADLGRTIALSGGGTLSATIIAVTSSTQATLSAAANWSSSGNTGVLASKTGYLLQLRQLGLSNTLWFVDTASGFPDARFLGDTYIGADATFSRTYVNSFTSSISDADPTVYYGVATDAAGKTIMVKGQLPATNSSYYNTPAAKDAHATITWTVLRADLNAAMHAFDSSFVEADFSCGFSHVQRGHVFARCFRGQQDSMAWVVSVSIASGNVDGMWASWKVPGQRWCGYHTEEQASQDSQFFEYTVSDMHATGTNPGGGPWTLNTTSSITAGAELAAITFTVASITPTSSNTPTTLYDLAAGDVLSLDWDDANGRREEVLITSITGTGPYTIHATAGYGAHLSQSHPSGEVMRPMCTAVNIAVDFTQGGAVFWNFTGDPTNANPIIDFGVLAGSHAGMARVPGSNAAVRVSASGWWVKQVPDETTAPQTGTDYSITRSPIFGGVSDTAHGADRCTGNGCQSHPEPPHQFAASATERNAAFDILPHVGDVGFNPTSCTLVTGTLYDCVPSLTLNPKVIPTLVMFGTKPGLDVSGPSSTIGGTSGDNYKFCIPLTTSECGGSRTVGHVYVNGPQLNGTSFFSSGGESSSFSQFNEVNLGIGPRPAWVNSFVQFKPDSGDLLGVNTRALSYGLLTPMRRMSITADTKISPDGKVVLLPMTPDQGKEFDMVLAWMPPLPTSDGVDRTNLELTPVTIGAVGGATEAIVEFGYDVNLYPTARTEVGVVASAAAPYFFAGDSYTAVPCAGGCTIPIPAVPDQVIYYRVKWRNSGHSVVQTSTIQALVDNGVGSPIGGGTVRSGTVVSTGKMVNN